MRLKTPRLILATKYAPPAILWGLFLLLSACTHQHPQHTRLTQADSLMDTRPDSALTLLQDIEPQTLGSDKLKARYALLLARARNKCYEPLLPCDSLLDFALQYYKRPSPARAMALLYKGRLLDEMQQTEAATRTLQEALSIIRKYPEETETQKHILSTLGNCYFFSAFYEEAFPIYQELYKYCITDKDKAIVLNNLASYYSVTEKNDSALIVQHQALAHAIASNDSNAIHTNLLSLSAHLYYTNQTDSALYYAKQTLSYLPQSTPFGQTYYMIGTILTELGAPKDSIIPYLEKSQTDTTFTGRAICLLDMAQLEKRNGNYPTAITYLERYIYHIDSIRYGDQSSEMEQVIYDYKAKIKIKEEELKGQRRTWYILGSAFSILFLTIISFQYQLNKKKRHQIQAAQLLQENQRRLNTLQTTIEDNQSIINMLKQKQDRLEEIRQNEKAYIEEKEEMVNKLKKEKQQLQNWFFEQSNLYKKIEQIQKGKNNRNKTPRVLPPNERIELKKIIFSIYASRRDELHQQYPRLVEDDLLLLCLQETDLDSKAIAICFGYEDTHAINQRKVRIKERMKVTEAKV